MLPSLVNSVLHFNKALKKSQQLYLPSLPVISVIAFLLLVMDIISDMRLHGL